MPVIKGRGARDTLPEIIKIWVFKRGKGNSTTMECGCNESANFIVINFNFDASYVKRWTVANSTPSLVLTNDDFSQLIHQGTDFSEKISQLTYSDWWNRT